MELDPPGEFEQLVLLGILRLGETAYALAIRDEIEKRTGRAPSRGAVYITLDRLEQKGYLQSHMAEETPERGGRARRYYQVAPAGVRALEQSWNALKRMWDGLEPKVRRT